MMDISTALLAAHHIQRAPLRSVAMGLAIGIGSAGCMDSDAQRQGVARRIIINHACRHRLQPSAASVDNHGTPS
jgi:hypothetical protein